jgi:hypothetical protein
MSFWDGGSASLDPPYKVLNGLSKDLLAITRCNLRFAVDPLKSHFQEVLYTFGKYLSNKSSGRNSVWNHPNMMRIFWVFKSESILPDITP